MINIPQHMIPEGFEICLATYILGGEEATESLTELTRQGWDYLKAEEVDGILHLIPTLSNVDGKLIYGGQVFMIRKIHKESLDEKTDALNNFLSCEDKNNHSLLKYNLNDLIKLFYDKEREEENKDKEEDFYKVKKDYFFENFLEEHTPKGWEYIWNTLTKDNPRNAQGIEKLKKFGWKILEEQLVDNKHHSDDCKCYTCITKAIPYYEFTILKKEKIEIEFKGTSYYGDNKITWSEIVAIIKDQLIPKEEENG